MFTSWRCKQAEKLHFLHTLMCYSPVHFKLRYLIRRSQLCLPFYRQGWYTTADFIDRMWTVHHQPADHWRALKLPVVLQRLSIASDLVTCQACIEHEFNPAQCSQLNQSEGRCVALLAGHKGIFRKHSKVYI